MTTLLLVLPGGARVSADARDGPGRFVWPLEPVPVVSRPFEAPPGPYAAGHRGVDLVASPGAVVRAAGDGVVVFAGRVVDREVVSVAHRGGLRTTYEPVSPSVEVGARVRAGDRLGVLVDGHRGCPAAACLHWGLRREGVYLDPLQLLVPLRVRLLPH
ncbi:murein hydrolase activator EnvC [Actinokineospora sp. UTMC 2448]|uniref:murein hydrolase activator EnvC family protein n=1 Tax=Actinokineospora sp. UTMC 2448 TaxID=2268449 RepID=UPI002164EF99|nr:M23 family metallopeptidase [Actinokineospora sp. UTMC 2448]UVS81109.1 Membrane-bound metallopeptidase [Actinokineospora sp. UTMC 2448]